MAVQEQGWFAPELAPLAEAFRRNFEDHSELGASVAVYIGGVEKAVLWGGYADAARTRPWQPDTLLAPASSIKGFYSFCIHKLVADGLIAYDDLVVAYWPEFAGGGKDGVTVRHLLGQTAGLQATFPVAMQRATLAELLPVMEAAVSATAPGTHGAYHSQTLMPLLAGLIYKVTGEEIAAWFRREIALPWGLDAYISLPASEFGRTAENVITAGSYYHRMTTNAPGVTPTDDDIIQRPVTRSFGGYTNARAMARMWGGVANGGVLDGVRLFSEEVAAACGAVQWSNDSWYPYENSTYSGVNAVGTLGFFGASAAFPMGPEPDAWGMPGAGGNLAMAEPKRRLGFGYALNSWHTGTDMGPRVKALIDGLFRCI